MHDGMMRVPLSSIETAIFDCPVCKSRKISNVSAYLKLGMPVKVNVTCSCGNKYRSILDKRKHYRRKTNLAGKYFVISEDNILSMGLMTVCDISITGMKLKINMDQSIAVGDILKVEFRLDDFHRSLIQKKVKIINRNELYLGTQFLPTENIGKALGFYLFA